MADTLGFSRLSSDSTLIQAIHAWEIYLKDQGRSIHTIKSFSGDLELLASFVGSGQRLAQVTTNNINDFLHWLQKERAVPCSPKSLARRVTAVKSFFRWLASSAVLSIDPAESVIQHSVISPAPEVLSVEEQSAVLSAALKLSEQKRPDARPFVLYVLLITTGIKKGECLAISLNHIDLNAPQGPILFVRYSSPANRYKERKLQLTDDWVAKFREYLEQYTPFDKLFPWSPRRLEYLLEDLGDQAGIHKHLSFDMCRWTSALNDWREGIEPDTIRQKIGVSKIQWRELSLKLKNLAGQ
jgi:integrase/recombinase XerD